MQQATQSSTYSWALTGVFAALHAMMSLVPFSMLIGGEGLLTMGLVTAPLMGYLLGPLYGTLSVLIGSFIVSGIINLGGILGPLVPVLAPCTGAFVAGLLKKGKPIQVVLVYMLGIEVFLFSPIAVYAIQYLWFQLICLLLMLVLMLPKVSNVFRKGINLSASISPLYWTASIWLLSLISVVGDSLIGGAISAHYLVYIVGMQDTAVANLYLIAIFVYPVERLIASVLITLAILAVSKSLERTSIPLPLIPQSPHDTAELSQTEIENE